MITEVVVNAILIPVLHPLEVFFEEEEAETTGTGERGEGIEGEKESPKRKQLLSKVMSGTQERRQPDLISTTDMDDNFTFFQLPNTERQKKSEIDEKIDRVTNICFTVTRNR